MKRKKHPNKDIESALQEFEAKGWRVEDSGKSGHSCHQMYCPHDRAHTQCEGNKMWCRKSVWKTPLNPVKHAKQLGGLVDRCIKFQKAEKTKR